MDRRNFFATVGGLIGISASSSTPPKPKPKQPWHLPPYIVEVWKPFSNPDIFNVMTLGSPVFIKFDNLKQAANWAMARKNLLENAAGEPIIVNYKNSSHWSRANVS